MIKFEKPIMLCYKFITSIITILKTNPANPDVLARGKESISINLKKESGVKIMRQLCQSADVLIEPFRPGETFGRRNFTS